MVEPRCPLHGKNLHPFCAGFTPFSGLGFTAGLALPVVIWASFWTRLSKFTTKYFSKSGGESPTDSTGWAFTNPAGQNREQTGV